MGGQHGISGTNYESEIPVPTDYKTTGTLTPDATCNYKIVGTYNGSPYLRRLDGAWFNWWRPESEERYITPTLGVMPSPVEYWWTKDEESIAGNYTPRGDALGYALVSVGTH